MSWELKTPLMIENSLFCVMCVMCMCVCGMPLWAKRVSLIAGLILSLFYVICVLFNPLDN